MGNKKPLQTEGFYFSALLLIQAIVQKNKILQFVEVFCFPFKILVNHFHIKITVCSYYKIAPFSLCTTKVDIVFGDNNRGIALVEMK